MSTPTADRAGYSRLAILVAGLAVLFLLVCVFSPPSARAATSSFRVGLTLAPAPGVEIADPGSGWVETEVISAVQVGSPTAPAAEPAGQVAEVGLEEGGGVAE